MGTCTSIPTLAPNATTVTVTSLLTLHHTITPTCVCRAETNCTSTILQPESSTYKHNCPLETIVTTTLPCYAGYAGYCPQPTTITVTKTYSNYSTPSSAKVINTSIPARFPGYGGYSSYPTASTSSSTINPAPTSCQNSTTNAFYIRNPSGAFFAFNPSTNLTITLPSTDGASLFNGLFESDQLGFTSNSTVQCDNYAAWVPLSGGGECAGCVAANLTALGAF